MHDHATIRVWARQHSVPIPARGRLPKRLLDEYDRLHAPIEQAGGPVATPPGGSSQAAKSAVSAAMSHLAGKDSWEPELRDVLANTISNYPVRSTLDQFLDDVLQPSQLAVTIEERVASITAMNSPSDVYEVWTYMQHFEDVITRSGLGQVIGSAKDWNWDLAADAVTWLTENAALAQMVKVAILVRHEELVRGASCAFDIAAELVEKTVPQVLLSAFREMELDESLVGRESPHWIRAWALARGIVIGSGEDVPTKIVDRYRSEVLVDD